jgi:hypothetical protein
MFMSRKVEKITVDLQAARLPQDLERYVQKALEMGATRAAVIKAEEIPVDERVTLKCQIPRCFGYGAGAHCPPNTMKPAELRDILKKYHWAVVFTMDVPPEVDAEFNEWYNTIYVPNYEKVPGVIRGRRYRATVGSPTYLTFYEFEHPKVSETPAWHAQRDAVPASIRMREHMRHAPGSPGVYVKTFQLAR